MEDHGVSAEAAGLSSDDGAASVSTLRASIPDADEIQFVYDVLIVACQYKREGKLHEKGAKAIRIINRLIDACTWRPISEDQRDGEPFVAYGNVYGGIAFPCAWRPNEYSPPDQPWMNLLTGSRLYEHVPTHWRPRIEPPAKGIEARSDETEGLGPQGESAVRQDAPGDQS